jgi:hypothetical protein
MTAIPLVPARLDGVWTFGFQKAGTNEWVYLDPSDPPVAAFVADHLVHTQPMEETMSAATAAIAASPPIDFTGAETQAEKMSLLVTIKNAASKALSAMLALPKKAWGWFAKTLHFEAAGQTAGGVWGWLRTRATAVFSFLGTPGLTGAGLLALGTQSGRRAIGFVLTPVRWLGKGLNWLYLKTANTLGNLGRPGAWVADRMMDGHEFVFGSGTTGAEPGMLERARTFWNNKIAFWVDTNSPLMYVARAIGALLLFGKVTALGALLPVTWLATTAKVVLALGMGGFVFYQAIAAVLMVVVYSALMTGRGGAKTKEYLEDLPEGTFKSAMQDKAGAPVVKSEVVAEATGTDNAKPSAPKATVPAGNRPYRRATARANKK